MRFVKGHGTENDFVLLPDPDGALDLSAALVRALCDRRRGIGADGVLRVVRIEHVGDAGDQTAEWFMDYRNADGSIAEMCGNGIRVFARYLVVAGWASPGVIPIGTRAGVKDVTVPVSGDVTVDMGPPRDDGHAAAVIAGRRLHGARVSMGNPHLVLLVDEPLEKFDLSDAPEVDRSVFPQGVNVEVVHRVADGHVEMRVHERGVGETRSCGTGVCAAAFAAAGGAPGEWTVDVPGGRLKVQLTGRTSLLTGPAVLVGEGVLDDAWLGAL